MPTLPTAIQTVAMPLPPQTRQRLITSGYLSTRDLEGVGTLELASELGVPPTEALAILRAAGRSDMGQTALQGAKTAIELLAKERSAKKILTFCGELDNILGGGISTGQITEFCGAPAVGKTQLGMQLAIDVQIPATFSGLEAEALYLDTEGSFLVDRAREMAEAFVKHMKKLAAIKKIPNDSSVSALTWERVLDKIHLVRALDLAEQLAALHNLETFLKEHPKVKLIVVDSITFHLRQDLQDMAHRTRMLAQLAQNLMRIAHEHDLAVVLMNHVTTKITAHQSRIVPALGDSWAHAATNRVILFWKEQQRIALLYKSPSLPAKSAEYLVTREGIRGPNKRSSQTKRPRQ